MEVKQQIQLKSAALLTAEPVEIKQLTQALQKLRVSMLMLREIVEDVADPTTHRELSLLTKITDDADPHGEAQRREQEAGEQEALARMAQVGLSPERAGDMVRVLQSLRDVMEAKAPDGSDPASRPPA